MNGKSLKHKIDFNNVIFSSTGLGSEVSAIVYLPEKLPRGPYGLSVVLDSINFPVEGRFMLLENKWTSFGTSFSGRKLDDYASFIINDNLFLVEADQVWQSRHKAVWKFDLNSRTWLQKSNFQSPENEFWIVQDYDLQYKNRGFVLVLKDTSAGLWEYNYENDSFSLLTNYPGRGMDVICFFIGDYLYAGCGRGSEESNVGPHSDFWRYSIVSGTWERLNNAPMAFWSGNHQVCSGGGKGYVYDPDKKALWLFDPESGIWSLTNKLPGEVRRWTRIAWLNDKVYLVGGQTQSAYVYLKDCWIYYPATNTWALDSFAPCYPTGFVCQYQNKILMGLGRQSFMDIFEKNIYSLVEK